ncbi:hypothetical protein [Thalassotalea maritima]|uniref:hypothetical protein n=1 Tax=Thalassotalea maritima TaxID=3242416 RepID=UPI0035297091
MKMTAIWLLTGILANVFLVQVKADTTTNLQTPWGPPVTVKPFERPLKPNQVYRVPANPNAGFFFPYFFSVPAEFKSDLPILVNPNNDGKVGVSQAQREYFASILNEQMAYIFGRTLGVVTFSPSFPRPKLDNSIGNLYIHALSREAILTKQPQLQRVDQQLLSMHMDLRQRLSSIGKNTSNTLLLYGFSAAADFVTRFATIHPTKVKAVVAGGLGGLPILPVSQLDGQQLTYPVGIDDFLEIFGRPFEQENFSAIPMLFVQGDDDENDSVPEGIEMQSRENFRSDSYSFDQSLWINEYFGTLPINRLARVRDVYQSVSPVDFAYASIANEKHTDKQIKPKAIAFFKCVLSADTLCADKIKASIERTQP